MGRETTNHSIYLPHFRFLGSICLLHPQAPYSIMHPLYLHITFKILATIVVRLIYAEDFFPKHKALIWCMSNAYYSAFSSSSLFILLFLSYFVLNKYHAPTVISVRGMVTAT